MRAGRGNMTQVVEGESGAVTRIEPVHVDRAGKTQIVARPPVSSELDEVGDDQVGLKTEPGRPVLRTIA